MSPLNGAADLVEQLPLMGIDFLDLNFRLEKSLRIKVPRLAFDEFFKTQHDLTVSQLYQVVLSAKRWTNDEVHCQTCGVLIHSTPVPGFCRHCGAAVTLDDYVTEVVRKCIVDAIGVKEEKVRPESLLIKDLGMS